MAGNTSIVWKFLRSKGLSPAQAAGVIGSMQGESGQNLDPAAENPGPDHALGIAQWLGARKTAAVMTKQLGPQLNHLWHELQGPERGALQALKATHTPEAAAIAWQRVFERGAPFEQKYNLRASNARKVFNQLHGVSGGGGTSSLPAAIAGTRTKTVIPGATIRTTIPTVDQAGFEQARKSALIGQMIARRNPNSFLLRSGLLNTLEPSLSAFTGSKTVTDKIPGATVTSAAAPVTRTASASFSTPPAQSGVANFEGTKVAAWIAPALHYARAHGWKGQVTSGYRSFADQTRIYNSGVRPAARPGTSNHEGTQFPRGAVDVSDAPTLSAILQRSPYGKRLKWAGAKDPVHFSHPHGGSY